MLRCAYWPRTNVPTRQPRMSSGYYGMKINDDTHQAGEGTASPGGIRGGLQEGTGPVPKQEAGSWILRTGRKEVLYYRSRRCGAEHKAQE